MVGVSLGWIASPNSNGLVLRMAKEAGIDYDDAIQVIMKSLGGMSLGRPPPRKKSPT